MLFYIHKATCISAQQTFGEADLTRLNTAADNKLRAVEPPYPHFNANALRRMSKSTRMGAGAALPHIMGDVKPDGIIIGTQLSGMEENSKFLNQLVEYDEDMLTPGSFVQGTPNTISSQIALISGNKNYNITHVHRGLSFENAIIDTAMLLAEHPDHTYLLGGVDEISANNYTLDLLAGWYQEASRNNLELYTSPGPGSIAGEGAAMFSVSNNPQNALAGLVALATVHSSNPDEVKTKIQDFLTTHIGPGEQVDLLISGENGDERLLPYYTICESLLSDGTPVIRFKHLSGEYPTAASFALWLTCEVLSKDLTLPEHMIKVAGDLSSVKSILIYNTHKAAQHSLMLVKVLR